MEDERFRSGSRAPELVAVQAIAFSSCAILVKYDLFYSVLTQFHTLLCLALVVYISYPRKITFSHKSVEILSIRKHLEEIDIKEVLITRGRIILNTSPDHDYNTHFYRVNYTSFHGIYEHVNRFVYGNNGRIISLGHWKTQLLMVFISYGVFTCLLLLSIPIGIAIFLPFVNILIWMLVLYVRVRMENFELELFLSSLTQKGVDIDPNTESDMT